jgi:hypothetical protein
MAVPAYSYGSDTAGKRTTPEAVAHDTYPGKDTPKDNARRARNVEGS